MYLYMKIGVRRGYFQKDTNTIDLLILEGLHLFRMIFADLIIQPYF